MPALSNSKIRVQTSLVSRDGKLCRHVLFRMDLRATCKPLTYLKSIRVASIRHVKTCIQFEEIAKEIDSSFLRITLAMNDTVPPSYEIFSESSEKTRRHCRFDGQLSCISFGGEDGMSRRTTLWRNAGSLLILMWWKNANVRFLDGKQRRRSGEATNLLILLPKVLENVHSLQSLVHIALLIVIIHTRYAGYSKDWCVHFCKHLRFSVYDRIGAECAYTTGLFMAR